jgi:hypothetical protein
MKDHHKTVLFLNATKHTNKEITEKTGLVPVVVRNILTQHNRRSYAPPPEALNPMDRKNHPGAPLPPFHPIAMANLPKLNSLEGKNND